MQKETGLEKYFTRNALTISAGEFLWGLGLPVILESTFIPVFLSTMGVSNSRIGLTGMIFSISIAVIPLFAAYMTARMPYKKGPTVWLQVIPSAAVMCLGIYYIYFGVNKGSYPVFIIFYSLFAMGLAATIPVWQNFIVKIFTPGNSIRGISWMMISHNCAKLLSGTILAFIIGAVGMDLSYGGWFFFLTGLVFMTGSLVYFFARENRDEIDVKAEESFALYFFHYLGHILKNRNMIYFLLQDIEFSAAVVAITFYARYAIDYCGIPVAQAGGSFIVCLFTSAGWESWGANSIASLGTAAFNAGMQSAGTTTVTAYDGSALSTMSSMNPLFSGLESVGDWGISTLNNFAQAGIQGDGSWHLSGDQWMEQGVSAGVSGLEMGVNMLDNNGLLNYGLDKAFDVSKFELFQSGTLGSGVASDFAGQSAFDLAGGLNLSLFNDNMGAGVGIDITSKGIGLNNGQSGYNVGNIGNDLNTMSAGLANAANTISGGIMAAVNGIGSAASWLGNAIGDTASWAGNAIGSAANWAYNAAGDAANFVGNMTATAINAVASAIPPIGSDAEANAQLNSYVSEAPKGPQITLQNGTTVNLADLGVTTTSGITNQPTFDNSRLLADNDDGIVDDVSGLTAAQKLALSTVYGKNASGSTVNPSDYISGSNIVDVQTQNARNTPAIPSSPSGANAVNLALNYISESEVASGIRNQTDNNINNLLNSYYNSSAGIKTALNEISTSDLPLTSKLNGYMNTVNTISDDKIVNNYINYMYSNDNQMSNQNNPSITCFPTSVAAALSNLGVENPVAAAGVGYADLLTTLITYGNPSITTPWENGVPEVNMVNNYFGDQVKMGWLPAWKTSDQMNTDFNTYYQDAIDEGDQVLLATGLTTGGHVLMMNGINGNAGITATDPYGYYPYGSGQKNNSTMGYTYGANEYLDWPTIYSKQVGYYGAFYIQPKY